MLKLNGQNEQQNTYINQAPADAKILVKNGKINYKVSKQKYNAVVAQQGNT